MYATPAESRKARKAHRCDSCGEQIKVGEVYMRWCYYDGEASTNKMHSECLVMHQKNNDGYWEYTPLSYERPNVGEYGRA